MLPLEGCCQGELLFFSQLVVRVLLMRGVALVPMVGLCCSASAGGSGGGGGGGGGGPIVVATVATGDGNTNQWVLPAVAAAW